VAVDEVVLTVRGTQAKREEMVAELRERARAELGTDRFAEMPEAESGTRGLLGAGELELTYRFSREPEGVREHIFRAESRAEAAEAETALRTEFPLGARVDRRAGELRPRIIVTSDARVAEVQRLVRQVTRVQLRYDHSI
jgi:glycine/D-amino acid oxidase-like deaminating enzyme